MRKTLNDWPFNILTFRMVRLFLAANDASSEKKDQGLVASLSTFKVVQTITR